MSELTEDQRKRLRWLSCLEASGVDNWSGMEYAQEMYEELYGDEDEE